MRSFTSTTSRPRIVTDIAPSPSTRESAFLRRTRSRSSLMALALLAELRRVRVIEAVHPHDVALLDAKVAQMAAEGRHVRRLHRPVAAVTAAVVGRAECPAAGVSHGPEARRAVRDHHADVAAPLALHADTLARDARPPLAGEGADDLEQLVLVRWAALQLEVDLHVIGRGRGALQRRNVIGARVDGGDEVVDVGEVAQRLDAACGRARADRDQLRRCAPDLVNALDVLRGRHRALDYRQVVGTVD